MDDHPPLRFLTAADVGIEQRNATAAAAALAAAMDDEDVRTVLHTVVHGLARGRSVHVIVEGETYSPEDAADRLGVSRTVVRRLMASYELPWRTKPGSRHRIVAAEDLLQFQRRSDAWEAMTSFQSRLSHLLDDQGVTREELHARLDSIEPTEETIAQVDALIASEPSASV